MLPARRDLDKRWRLIQRLLAGTLPVAAILYAFQVLPALGIVVYKEQFLIGFLALALAYVFIVVPPGGADGNPGAVEPTGRAGSSAPGDDAAPVVKYDVPWYDCLLVAAALAAGGYTVIRYHTLLPEIGLLTADKVAASLTGLLLLLEAARRVAGRAIMLVGVAALVYASFGHLLSGPFGMREIRPDRLALYNYMGQDAVHGTPLFVAATVVTAFLLFGQVLFATGAGQAISNLGLALFGRFRGGAAKVSIAASAIFGSLSGSASANVATTGLVTIPLIRRSGYPAHQAAAIEAVASTGGLILPPIMAATGFVMAEFLGVPYTQIALAALWPALLFYFGLFVQVDLEAARSGIRGVADDTRPDIRELLIPIVPVLVPVAVLIHALFWRFQSPQVAALLATATALLVGIVLPRRRIGPAALARALIGAGEGSVYIAVVCGIAGLVVGCLGLTGLGGNLSFVLVDTAGGNLWLLVLLAGIGSIVLGMGVPVTATYIILVILIGPALIRAGIPDLAAHMYVFYFGTLSFLTPPVCVSVFVAAALAGAPPLRTALVAMRLAAVAYVVPVFFLFDERFFLGGGASETLRLMLASLVGVFLLSAGLAGYYRSPLSLPVRIFWLAGGVLVLGWGADHWPVPVAVAGGLVAAGMWRRPAAARPVE